MQRVLINTGSSTDIISFQCLEQLQYNPKTIKDVHYPIVSFRGSIIHPVGVKMGDSPLQQEGRVRFIIVKNLTAFNIILGRPTLNSIKVVVIPHLMLIKSVCSNGSIDTIYGNQQLARDCYLTTLDPAAWGLDAKEASRKHRGREKKRKGTESMRLSAAHNVIMLTDVRNLLGHIMMWS